MDRCVLSLKHTCCFACVVVDGIATHLIKVCNFDHLFKCTFACDDDHLRSCVFVRRRKKPVHAVRRTGALQMRVSGKKRNLNCWGQLTLIAQAFGLPLKCNGTLNRTHKKKASEWCHASTTPERHIRWLLKANPPTAVVVVVCSDQFHCCLSGCCSFAAGRKENSLPVGGLLLMTCRKARIATPPAVVVVFLFVLCKFQLFADRVCVASFVVSFHLFKQLQTTGKKWNEGTD